MFIIQQSSTNAQIVVYFCLGKTGQILKSAYILSKTYFCYEKDLEMLWI